MIRTLIIEDETPAANRLEKLLKEIDPGIEILDKLESVESAVEWFQENKQPDLLMLDIQLADGQSFDIFKKVKVDCFVIFTTAYDEYAIKAFELNSIDYLLKPIDKAKLSTGIQKFRNLNSSKPDFDFNELINTIEQRKTTYKKRFAISIGTKIKSIETKDIAYFYSLQKYTFLGTFGGQEFPADFSLDRLENILDPEVFFRINRQYLVNYRAIGKIHVLSKSRLELEISGYKERMPVSSGKAHLFRLWIDK
jgi:DNA-binding LytR/AlgR family response regulator